MADTCFVFKEKFYQQKFGMQMGNWLFLVFSGICMEFYENRIGREIMGDSF